MSLLDKASLIVTPNAYKESKLYSVIPSSGAGDMSVVRATTATRVNSSGLIESVAVNVPRIDYTNGSCPSLLVEPQRTNLLTYSEQFDNAGWTKINASILSNSIVSPDGNTTADKLVEDSSNANHLIQKAIVSTNSAYSFSVFAKKSERNWIVLRSVNASFQNVKAWFNIDNGTIGTLENGATATIENYGNGWYKCTMILPSFSTGFEFRVSLSNGNGVDTYLGNGTSGIYLWGAQLEQGSYPTSYIPTTSASVTRNADVISKTGISSLIGQTEGTVFVDFVCNGFTNFGTPLCINDGGFTNSIWITTFGNGDIRGEVYGFSNVQASFTLSGGVVGQRYKLALVYKANDFAMYVNGVLVGSDTSGSVPINLSRVDFDYTNASVFVKSALKINSSALWKTRLTNTELAQLTTI